MIVQVTVPNNTVEVKYGSMSIMPDGQNHIDVPDYVAKSLITIPNVTCPIDLSASYDSMLEGSERYMTNHIFWVYGQQLPADTIISHANDEPPAEDEIIVPDWNAAARELMTVRGAPSVSLS